MTMLLPIFIALCYVSGIGVHAAVFTVKNNCPFPIWPAALTGTGSQIVTGFQLDPQGSRTINVSAPWSGRFWARFQCSSGDQFKCNSGDCGSGQIECNGAGGGPPTSLLQFTLGGSNGFDFYDISLVDGFNLPVSVLPMKDGCPITSCGVDINNKGCPNELAIRDTKGGIIGCKSACLAFNQPEYCCTGQYGSPATCKPSNYSTIFKTLCPQAYSYAYDDATSTFTCQTGGDYVFTFCP